MKHNVKIFSCLLVILMIVSLMMAGCNAKGAAAGAAPNDTAPAVTDPNVDALDAQPEQKELVTIRLSPPIDWMESDTYLWAWKDGGEDAFAEFPGERMEWEEDYLWCACTVPGWVDQLSLSAKDSDNQTKDLTIEPGKDLWIILFDDMTADLFYEDPFAGMDFSDVEYTSPYANDPIYQAAEQGDFETVKSLLPTIEDRSILNDWVFNDFNYDYAIDAIRDGDYATAIEFFRYCAYEDYHPYADMIELLLSGEREAAIDTIRAMEFAGLDISLDKSWGEIITMVSGGSEKISELDRMLIDRYVSLRLSNHEPTFAEDALSFGSTSSWQAHEYLGEITDTILYYPIENIKTLKSQCGSEANGKVLILRSQKAYPQGTAHYAIDMLAMSYLNTDLYPASLSEVEYIITASYDYTVEGTYRQTISNGDNSVSDEFTYLRMKGQVQLQNVATGQNIQTSPWITGTGEVEAHFSDRSYQCSNLPETGAHIYSAVEKVRELKGE